MWFDLPASPTPWDDAIQHLLQADERLARIIGRVGPCTMSPRRDYFVALCKAIFSQQLSTIVAATIFSRFRDLFPNRRPTPDLVLKALAKDPLSLRQCGLSRPKMVYIRDLAEHFVTGRIPTRKLCRMSDQEVIDALVAVNGIGRWTAEMFLMFVLNRPDVLPADDLGVRVGIQEIFDLLRRPTPKEVLALGEPWRPYRSIATWYVWRRNASADATPIVAVEPTKPAILPRKRPSRRV